MGYTEQNLMSGESVVYTAKLHEVIFLGPIMLLSFGLLFGKGAIWLDIIAVILFILTFIDYKNSEFVVTNKRIVVKTGIVSHNSFELMLNKIEGIALQQDLFGKIFNYGGLAPTGTGGKIAYWHKCIKKPLVLRKSIQEQIDTK